MLEQPTRSADHAQAQEILEPILDLHETMQPRNPYQLAAPQSGHSWSVVATPTSGHTTV